MSGGSLGPGPPGADPGGDVGRRVGVVDQTEPHRPAARRATGRGRLDDDDVGLLTGVQAVHHPDLRDTGQLNTPAITRFWTTSPRARRDSEITAGTVASSSRTTTASAVSSARSDPARPIATPVLLEQALYHVEHLRLGLRDTPVAAHTVAEVN